MKPLLLFATALAICLLAEPADAVLKARRSVESAVSNCQGALPAFEGAFRKRPQAIRNESAATAFITCAWPSEIFGSEGATQIEMRFNNKRPEPVEISCTLVIDERFDLRAVAFVTKTITLDPSNPRGEAISWFSSDNEDRRMRTPSLSCAIPPGIELTRSENIYFTDVGIF